MSKKKTGSPRAAPRSRCRRGPCDLFSNLPVDTTVEKTRYEIFTERDHHLPLQIE